MRYRKSASVALPPLALVLTVSAIAIVRPEIVRAELGWHILPNSPTASRHDDVQFLNPDLGWVVNSNGQVWKTTNGGESWELQLQISETLRGVHFLDESLGFVSTINAPPDSLLYRTTNGGATWTNVTLPGQLPYGICGLMGVGDHIFASGAYTGSMTFGRRFLRSTDRGVTWTNFDLAPHLFNVIDCYFTSPDSGFVVGGRRDGTINHPVILFTPDGGQTWQTRYYSTAFDNGTYCWKIFFVNALVGYVSIQGQAVLKTTDGGLTWVRKPVPGASLIQGVGFASEMLGWVDGVSPPLVTTDGGETWNPTYFTGNPNTPWSDVNRFQMLSPSLGYCSGRRIYKYESVTTAVPVALVTPSTRFNLTSYPNPAVGEVVLRYVLNEAGPVRVRVYTLLGRYIRTLYEGWQPAGSKSILWQGEDEDGRHLGRGIYFYRVDAEGTAETARLVLVK